MQCFSLVFTYLSIVKAGTPISITDNLCWIFIKILFFSKYDKISDTIIAK